jgi:DNA-binding transcriptional regulator YiaG
MDTKIEQWQEIISRWRESGQTQKDFCRTRDIKLSTLHYWMKRVKKTSTAQAALPGLVRIAPPVTSFLVPVDGLRSITGNNQANIP